ncbi:MAG: phosphoenolpyruvate synthase, partial [Bacteroidetes bacterium]|nr:phosphoenolpyruvate synthase [Bacteroidota bacterium]
MKENERSYIIRFSEMGIEDVEVVGGKNASLGEMIRHLTKQGIKVPDGFATTAEAYWNFIHSNKLDEVIEPIIKDYQNGAIKLEEAGLSIRKHILKGTFPSRLASEIQQAYKILSDEYQSRTSHKLADPFLDVAVRSSATAEDLPGASFAGQQETYLNVSGVDELMKACKSCYASLFTNRAITYREKMGFDHMKVALSIGVQKMVRADDSCSGVMFTTDTETGFPNVIVITGSWGLGETIVKGSVNPDQFYVFKPGLNQSGRQPILEKSLGSKEVKMIYASRDGEKTVVVPNEPAERNKFVLNDEEIIKLAEWGLSIENHYEKAMDIEWVKEDKTGELYILQARPETVHATADTGLFKTYELKPGKHEVLVKGLSIGSSITTGKARVIHDVSELKKFDKDTILVTEMTEPDWVPAMKSAAGIVTDFGGRTCHAAIVSRELGIPAVVGTGNATKVLKDGQEITLSSAEGDVGYVYAGELDFNIEETDLSDLPEPNTRIMLNLATPESAFKWWRLPVDGVGLARMEFIISNHIKIHPMALVHPNRIHDEEELKSIRKLTAGYTDLKLYFVDKLASGISKIAASQYPKPVIVRTSDFKTNEYAGLIGGEHFEPREENPMLGWRGASRYYSEGYREGFALECRALKKVREEIGLDNLIVMIPFCRTVDEAHKVLKEMENNGLKRGENGLKIFMMCEIPSNYILATHFARLFDGFSIGSNDLTQLILGVDRD